jgi:hypothetical protein
MYLLGYSISFFLEYSLIVLKSLKDDLEALNLLSEYNYSETTILDGLNTHSIAQEMESAQIKYHAEMITVGEEFKKNYQDARILFKDYTTIILLEFKNNEDNKLVTLASEAIGERKPIEWLKRSKEFYTYVIKSPKVIVRISQYGFTSEKMTAALNKVIAAEDSKSLYNRLKGDAEDATTKRDAALSKLVTWIRKLLKVSEVAFKPNPQFLEKCGIRVLSTGYKRVRAKTASKKTTVNSGVIQPTDM